MKIDKIQITVKELADGYAEKGAGGIEGIVAYSGKLNVRPPYQREYVYDVKERDEVIRTIEKGFPLNIMYWAKAENGYYELMDGQQRTISICRYAAESERTFAVDEKYYFNLEKDIQEKIDNYILDIYICDGAPSEVHEWFKVINIAGKPLTAQELRNTAYTGTWLNDAKIHFSKPNCAAYNMGKNYVSGSPIRQELLEKALLWKSKGSIEKYMAEHQHDPNANELWTYFRNVIDWVQLTFKHYRKEMKGVDWGSLYDLYGNGLFDTDKLEAEIKSLMADDDVTNKKGIYTYVLTGDLRYLSIRAFTDTQKRTAYEQQNGICPICGEHFEYKDMEGDHITPWSRGGKTLQENCQMLCSKCNASKSDR